MSLSEIARQYGVTHSTVSRATRALGHEDLMAVVLGGRCQPKLPEVPAPDLDAPVDVMAEVVSVIEDIRHMRAWLASEEAKVALKTPVRVSYAIALFDKRLRWAEAFVSTRSKLLELISVDHWLREMLAIVEEVGRCPKCGEDTHARERVLERIRAKLLGRQLPASDPSGGDQSVAEVV